MLGPRVIADSGHATSYSFSDTLIRSPWLVGGPDEERLLTAVGAATLEDGSGAAGFDLAASSSFASRGLAAHALAAAGDQDAGAELLSKIEAGALSATLAAAEASGSWDPALVRTRASLEGSQWILDGEKYFVPHADTANVLLVVARSTAGPSLFAVEAAAAGLTVTAMPTIDPTRPLSRVRLSGVPAVLVGHRGSGRQADGARLSTWRRLAGRGAGPRHAPLSRAGCRCLEAADEPSGTSRDGTPSSGCRPRSLGSLWQHARRLADDAAEGGVAAAMAHIACSETFTRRRRRDPAARRAKPRTRWSTRSRGSTSAAQSSDLLFGGPALYYERLLERMDI